MASYQTFPANFGACPVELNLICHIYVLYIFKEKVMFIKDKVMSRQTLALIISTVNYGTI